MKTKSEENLINDELEGIIVDRKKNEVLSQDSKKKFAESIKNGLGEQIKTDLTTPKKVTFKQKIIGIFAKLNYMFRND